MPIYLIRHAKAGSRSAWTESDSLRPLSDEGRMQAVTIGEEWAFETPVVVRSSPAVRCIQTVQHLADCFGLPVEVDERLAEGTPFETLLPALEEAPEGSVWSSHGDVIPDVINAMLRRGMEISGSAGALKKGAMFVVHRENGRFVRAEYVDAPRV